MSAPAHPDWRAGFATLVMTSCNRPDELETTLSAIAQRDLTGLKRLIIIEDSENPDIEPLVQRCLGDIPHLFLQNPKNIGQIRSIDRAYAEVDTPYILHCEEDWLFPSSLFLDASRRILDENPDIIAVLSRDIEEFDPALIAPDIHEIDGHCYRRADPKATRLWGGFSFNPGLRRLSDYQDHGPYVKIGPEQEISMTLKFKGFVLAHLVDGDVRHIGENPTFKVDETKTLQSPRHRLTKLKRKLQFGWFRRFR